MDLIAKFLFELVNDGLQRDATYSVGRLEFEQDGFAFADHGLDFFCVIHEQGRARMQDCPGNDQTSDNHTEGEVIVPFWLVRQQNDPGDEGETG
jgi:hypothetical protein